MVKFSDFLQYLRRVVGGFEFEKTLADFALNFGEVDQGLEAI